MRVKINCPRLFLSTLSGICWPIFAFAGTTYLPLKKLHHFDVEMY
jgi:hypothetical protein